MKTVHLIYPHKQKISAPDTIGFHLGEGLVQRGYSVKYYDWNSLQTIHLGPDDVLLGHAHPYPLTIFRNSCVQPGWKRIILMEPFVHTDVKYVAFLEPIIRKCDLFLAITGNYWADTLDQSQLSHWKPKFQHLDLAVDRKDFPRIKEDFNQPGKRKFMYIGNNNEAKNTQYLSRIAHLLPGIEFAWIGRGTSIDGLHSLGFLDFSSKESQATIRNYDFLITVGSSDANPTTILEAMAWGLIPVCTPTSGYSGFQGIINLPLNDASAVVSIINDLQMVPESDLEKMRKANDDLLKDHFNWDRFISQVVEAIESDSSPKLGNISLSKRFQLMQAELIFFLQFTTGNYLERIPNKIRKFLKTGKS